MLAAAASRRDVRRRVQRWSSGVCVSAARRRRGAEVDARRAAVRRRGAMLRVVCGWEFWWRARRRGRAVAAAHSPLAGRSLVAQAFKEYGGVVKGRLLLASQARGLEALVRCETAEIETQIAKAAR